MPGWCKKYYVYGTDKNFLTYKKIIYDIDACYKLYTHTCKRIIFDEINIYKHINYVYGLNIHDYVDLS